MSGTSGVDDAPAVEVVDLVKRYPKREDNAVDGLSFTVRPGEVFGLLGPNGAGKSTTVGILTTRLPATSGAARLSGIDLLRDPVSARARLAVVAQRPNLDRSLTPRQNLTFHAAYHGVGRADRNERAAALLEQFGLADQADAKVDWYSGGMAQRLMIARSLIHEPDVLFLDEPTTGLDPQARLFVWDRIGELRDRGVTILLTTHDMNEAADLCDRVGIVDHGKLLALDTPEALTRGIRAQAVLDLSVTPAAQEHLATLLSDLGAVEGVERVEQPAASPAAAGAQDQGPAAGDLPATVQIRLYLSADPALVLPAVVGLLSGRSAALTNVRIGTGSLEDVFIDLTGRGLR
ncbi:MAG: type transport system ATP-binding protein [Actinomycetota bacterium]|nr:type transport system ATP-binding protein [Actinomycetota bacterium]MDQ1664656.1 type transport system ATP-binding protein [Actinomycetota bacterium]